MSGPLAGMKVIEIVGLGPAPFCGMMLADMGAEVIRVDRPGGNAIMSTVAPEYDVMARNRRSIALNLKKPGATEAVLALIDQADIVIEGFRPGVMERMGLGPDVCLARNPKLVYGRVTGWGQDGPLAQAAGHDINYIATAGVLHTFGHKDAPPVPPMNLVGDFGGGGMLLAFGVICAAYQAKTTGIGQVVDAAMAEGAALLATMNWGFRGAGYWNDERGSNINDGGAFYYASYACADGHYVCIASAEPQFYAELRAKLNLTDPLFDQKDDPAVWPELKQRLSDIFITQPRQYWCDLLEGGDSCFAPVLNWRDAPKHPHNVARKMFIEVAGVTQPAPAPRFSATPTAEPTAPVVPGVDSVAVLTDWGFDVAQISALRESGALEK
ncbi:MAG: CoA transferase [Gammaproteobacteria bacterium]|nr:CoA transferase [Gammaproteobacteria bacterium]